MWLTIAMGEIKNNISCFQWFGSWRYNVFSKSYHISFESLILTSVHVFSVYIWSSVYLPCGSETMMTCRQEEHKTYEIEVISLKMTQSCIDGNLKLQKFTFV